VTEAVKVRDLLIPEGWAYEPLPQQAAVLIEEAEGSSRVIKESDVIA
jgi:hypothetical protein